MYAISMCISVCGSFQYYVLMHEQNMSVTVVCRTQCVHVIFAQFSLIFSCQSCIVENDTFLFQIQPIIIAIILSNTDKIEFLITDAQKQRERIEIFSLPPSFSQYDNT